MIHGKVLVTGDLGYIGSVLVPLLLERGHQVVGLDIGYFADCLLNEQEPLALGAGLPTAPTMVVRSGDRPTARGPIYARHTVDIRDVNEKMLDGVEAIIHLAGLSNDPLGEFAPSLTEEINRDATIRLGRLARKYGVRRFVYASSQSMYGISNTDAELEEDTSEKRPLTVYARTKWEAECELKKLADDRMTVVCFRPSTVFGASPRLRCDIVYNNLVACAYTTGRIEIKSDGTPYRPVVHVRDVCSAFLAGLDAPASLVNGRSYNVGIPHGNFTVRELAEAAQRAVPGSTLTFTGEHGNDSRTYRVCFRRILTELKDYYRPEWDLSRGGKELVEFFERVGFNEDHFEAERVSVCTNSVTCKTRAFWIVP